MTDTTTQRQQPDLWDVLLDIQSVYLARRDTYKATISCGHRPRRDPREERIIQSLNVAAGLVEQEYYRRGQR